MDTDERVGHADRMLGVLSLGVMALVAGQLVLPPLLPSIIAEFDIPRAHAGAGLTLMWASAAIAMYPGGRASDQLSRKTVLVASIGAFVAGLVVLANAVTFPLFLFGVAIVGIGVGLYEPTNVAFVSELFEHRRGQAMGVVSASYNVGSMAAAGLAVAALALGAWRLAFLPLIAAFVLVALLLHYWGTERYRIAHLSFDVRDTLRRLLSVPSAGSLLALFCLYMFIWQGSVSFFPTFLQDVKGYSPTFANAAFASIFVVGLLVSPVVGRLGDRFGHVHVGALAPLLGAIGLVLIVISRSPAPVIVGVLFFATGLVAFWPVMTADLMGRLSPASLAGDYGGFRAIFFGVGSLGPTYVGVIADYVSLTTAYWGIVVCFLIALVLLGRLARG